MSQLFSIVILVGGRSTRLGQDKVFVDIGGQTLIQRVLDRLAPLDAPFVLVAAEPVADPVARYGRDVPVVADRYPGGGSLGGLFTGLAAATTDAAFVMAVDMPFINPDLIRHLADRGLDHDVVIPLVDERPQPTHALYTKRCLDPIERRLQANDLKMIGFHHDVRVCRVPEAEIRQVDPDLLSFFNLNRPDDLERARALAAAGAPDRG